MTTQSTGFLQMAHERSRQLIAVILLHQLATAGGQEGDGGAAGSQGPHIKVLSRENIARSLSMAEGARAALDFVEDMFAVRLPKLFIFAIIFGFGLLLTSVLPIFLEEVLSRLGAPRHVRVGWGYLTYVATFIGALWVALAAVGIDFLGIVLTLGVVTIAVSVGVQAIIGNIASAFTIQITDKAELGQDITVNGVRGIIVEMNLSDVVLRLPDGDIVFLPNNYFTQYPVRRHSGGGSGSGGGGSQADMVMVSGATPVVLEAMVVQAQKNKHS